MKRTLALGFILGAVVAMAQDRNITVREVDVQTLRAEIDVLPDGGCVLAAVAVVVPPSVAPVHSSSRYAFNGPRCATVKNAILAAAKKDIGVGSGTDP
jgi:hypothetical protein